MLGCRHSEAPAGHASGVFGGESATEADILGGGCGQESVPCLLSHIVEGKKDMRIQSRWLTEERVVTRTQSYQSPHPVS